MRYSCRRQLAGEAGGALDGTGYAGVRRQAGSYTFAANPAP